MRKIDYGEQKINIENELSLFILGISKNISDRTPLAESVFKIIDTIQHKDIQGIVDGLEELKTFCGRRNKVSPYPEMQGITTLDICKLQDKLVKYAGAEYAKMKRIDFSQYNKITNKIGIDINDCLFINAYGGIKLYLIKFEKIFIEHGYKHLFQQIHTAFHNDHYNALKALFEQARKSTLKKIIPELEWFGLFKLIEDVIFIKPTSHHQNGKNDILE